MLTILKLALTQKPYDNIAPFYGCKFCKSCGGQYSYYGGTKSKSSSVDQQNNSWKIYGEECSDQYDAATDQQLWKLCCGKDQVLNAGLCRMCQTCGGDYKNYNGGRKTTSIYDTALTTSIYGENCSPTLKLGQFGNFSLCCTQKNIVSLCFKCNQGQIEGGMFQLGKNEEIFDVNQMGSCGKNDQYFTQIDNYYLCNNKYCPDNYVFQNNLCLYKCVDKCQTCSSLTTCSLCYPNYKLIEGKCFLNCTLQNCEVCSDEAIQQCIKCVKGYYLNQGQCQQCSFPNCQTCILASDLKSVICQSCQQNYILNTNLIQCDMSCPENCQKCSEPNKCLKCQEGYKQQIQQNQIICVVVLCPNYCKCEQDNVCSSCQDGYKLVTQNDQTQNICQLQCPINCEQCDSSTPRVCTQCQKGYSLDPQQKCQQCDIKNCSECYYDASTSNFLCKQCESNYILNNQKSQCDILCPENCQSCIEFNSCSKCKQGYRKILDKSQIICQPILCIPNCKYCNEESKCGECDDDYEFSKDLSTCIKIDCKSGCICSKYVVQSCVNGMSIYKNSCLPECPQGRYFDRNECKICKIPFCQKCSSEFVCAQCEIEYRLQDGYLNAEEQISCLNKDKCNGEKKDTPISKAKVCISLSSTPLLRFLNEIIILLIYLLI